jgi:hemerythrin-like domain-containing protein
MLNPPYEGATEEQLRHPMVRELLMIHGMFRRELQAMLGFVDEILAGNFPPDGTETTARVHALIRSGVQYNRMLHHHHHLETSMLFPALQRENPGVDSLIDKLNADHDEISVLIDRFGEAIRSASAIHPDIVNTDLRRLSDALTAHLAYEETHVCPLLARFSGWM